MSLTFLTPFGVLVALAALVPLAALAATRQRAQGARGELGLADPGARRLLVALVAVIAAGALVGLAAAQPVLERRVSHQVRTDAEVFLVVDVSRSMLARTTIVSPMRIARAKTVASAVRAELPAVRVGIASLSDRVLPHLFPSADANVFEATLERAIGIEQPPPRTGYLGNVTRLDALGVLRGLRFFSPAAERRLVVALTDGESLPVANARLGTLMRRPPAIDTIFVHVWDAEEKVYDRGVPEPQYEPDPSAREILDRLASATGGAVYSESEAGAVAQRAISLLGDGPTSVEGETASRTALAPFFAGAAFLSLALLLWWRER